MASRFIFQKLASEMSRSTSLLGAHASSARVATTPRTLSNLFHGDAVHHPSNRGIHDFSWRRICKAARQAEDADCKPKSLLPVYDSIKKDTDTTICLLALVALAGSIYSTGRLLVVAQVQQMVRVSAHIAATASAMVQILRLNKIRNCKYYKYVTLASQANGRGSLEVAGSSHPLFFFVFFETNRQKICLLY
ncbi:hypothetical protein BS78_07G219400 [Paspalum vaginatum]|nr:hypothetical protein BS78_07G219400 [Paspalum vaginatum]KAJ1269542.1 hypothetical protein BS78_07G219400 [Paspalum vaginatum]